MAKMEELMNIGWWDKWAQEAHSKLESSQLLHSLRPICLRNTRRHDSFDHRDGDGDSDGDGDGSEPQVFDDMHPWDRSSVEVEISEATFRNWLLDISSTGDENDRTSETIPHQGLKNLILFSGNDYLALSSHPSITNIAAKAMLEHGMGPKGSALFGAYTNYHRLLESCLADLKKKEDCLLCPSGFAANMAMMVTVGGVGSLLASSGRATPPAEHDPRVAIFSDALNHASIIDGIRLAARQRSVEVFVYKHCDMSHLSALLSSCALEKKVVVTDSLFSMDGDFAPMNELVKLRRKYGFLLIIDDAHGTFVCGKNGGGVSEQFNCEKDVDICTGTLSKAAACQGGFIACSKTWKQLIQSRGRNFMFSTAIPVPIAAAAHAAVTVARKEMWRRRAIWERVQDFRDLTGIPITSHIISLVMNSNEKALEASQELLKSGFHVVAIKPPVVPPDSCRLRVSLSAAHTRNDMERLAAALSRCVNFKEMMNNIAN